MATTQFFPLNGLQSAVAASRVDLAKVRAVNAELTKKVAALNKRDQFAAPYITQQTALLREEAAQTVTNYLTQEKTYERLANIKAQSDYWSVPAFLSRGMIVPDPGLEFRDTGENTVKLLKTLVTQTKITNALLSFAHAPLASVTAAADTAATTRDWPTLSAAYNEISGRAERGDDEARRARNRLDETDIPEVQEANGLITEAQHLAELLGYTVRSIGSGDADLGLRMEGYARQEKDRMESDQRSAA